MQPTRASGGAGFCISKCAVLLSMSVLFIMQSALTAYAGALPENLKRIGDGPNSLQSRSNRIDRGLQEEVDAEDTEVSRLLSVIRLLGLAHSKSNIMTDLKDFGIPRQFIANTTEDAKRVIALFASRHKEVMFTTLYIMGNDFPEEMMNLLLHVWESLRSVGRLDNAVLITYEELACHKVWKQGIPCMLDRLLPQPEELPGFYRDQNPHYYQKHAWGSNLVQWGYSPLFFEADQVFLKDPFDYFNPEVDIQALSDWEELIIPPAKERIKATCRLYHMGKVSGETALYWGPHDPQQPENHPAIIPCMSTGFWHLKPTKPVKEFLEFFLELMLQRPYSNEQPLYNEALIPHLIGQKGERPLSMSLLDEQHFSNFGVYQFRLIENLPVDPVVLHAGFIHGFAAKTDTIKHHRFWRGHLWTNMTAAHSVYKAFKNHGLELG